MFSGWQKPAKPNRRNMAIPAAACSAVNVMTVDARACHDPVKRVVVVQQHQVSQLCGSRAAGVPEHDLVAFLATLYRQNRRRYQAAPRARAALYQGCAAWAWQITSSAMAAAMLACAHVHGVRRSAPIST